MSEATHTPGPWAVANGFVPGLGDEGALGVVRHDHPEGERGNSSICVISPAENLEEQDLPNARLIAAAPEMLEALKAAKASSESEARYVDDFLEAMNKVMNEFVEPAIIKATGKGGES